MGPFPSASDHRGVWQPQVKMSADYYSFCGGSVGDMFCSVFAWTKGLRRRVGSNLGSQMMRISCSTIPNNFP